MPIPWPSSLLQDAPLLALAAAIAGGLLGTHVGGALASPRRPAALPRLVPGAALAVLIACLAIPMYTTAGPPVRAAVALDRTGGEAVATVKLDPPSAAHDAKWFHVMAWQGGGSRLVALHEIGDGVYRTAAPIPVHGDWKAMIRLHTGSAIRALPIYMPGDAAIPAREVPAPARFDRAFQADHDVLRREEKGAASWLTGAAYGALAVIALAWLAAIGAAVTRFERRNGAAAAA
jgi:hypothetical protein